MRALFAITLLVPLVPVGALVTAGCTLKPEPSEDGGESTTGPDLSFGLAGLWELDRYTSDSGRLLLKQDGTGTIDYDVSLGGDSKARSNDEISHVEALDGDLFKLHIVHDVDPAAHYECELTDDDCLVCREEVYAYAFPEDLPYCRRW